MILCGETRLLAGLVFRPEDIHVMKKEGQW